MGGEFEGGQNVVVLEIGIVAEDLFMGCARSEKLEDIGDANAQAADAGPSTAFSFLNSDALKTLGIH